MKKSLAQLKKDAKTGNLFATMLIRCGKSHEEEKFPERLQGKRQIVGSNSVAIFMKNADGEKSELRITSANLVQYTDDSLTTYYPGYRKPTAEEQLILDEWATIEQSDEYQQRLTTDCLTDGSSTYWQRQHFFSKKDALYLLGHDTEKGMKADLNRKHAGHEDFIRDNHIRGSVEMMYRLEKEAA